MGGGGGARARQCGSEPAATRGTRLHQAVLAAAHTSRMSSVGVVNCEKNVKESKGCQDDISIIINYYDYQDDISIIINYYDY